LEKGSTVTGWQVGKSRIAKKKKRGEDRAKSRFLGYRKKCLIERALAIERGNQSMKKKVAISAWKQFTGKEGPRKNLG